MAVSKKTNELLAKVYIVKFLIAVCEILIFLPMMVWQDADSPPPSGVNLSRSAPKPDTSRVCGRGIQTGDDLTLLTRTLFSWK